MIRLLISLSIIFSFLSCQNISFKIDKEWQEKYPIEFSVQQYKIKDLIISSQLRANSLGDTLLCLLQFNTNEKTQISPFNFRLQTPENYKCAAFNNQIPIEFETQTQMALLFSPVNDRTHFIKTGEKGFLQKQYQLYFKYQNKKYKIDYDVNENDYQKYFQEIINSNEVSYYSLINTNQLIDKQIKYSTKLNLKNNTHCKVPQSLHFTDQEISHNGIIIKCNPYTKNQNLYLHLKIVNHGETYINFKPNELKIIDSENTLTPINKHKIITLKKGDRYISKYQFGKLTKKKKQLQMDLSAFTYTQTGQKIFTIQPQFYLLSSN